MTPITLLTQGVEKTLADWGIALDFTISRQNKARHTARLRSTERFDPGATQWQGPVISGGIVVLQHAVIYRDRTLAGGAFSGGSILFQGYFDDPERSFSGEAENVTYRLHNVWWLFERNPFKQYRNVFTGWDHAHQRVQAASVQTVGSSYHVGDILTVTGGAGSAAQVTVVAVNGSGGVTAVYTSNAGGSYTTTPPNPNTPSGGSGSGCKLSLAFSLVPITAKAVTSELFLYEKLDSPNQILSFQSNGAQIGEVMDWVNETYNPTRRGANSGQDPAQDVVVRGIIDPNTYVPVTRLNSLFCAEAVTQCLRLDPDAVILEREPQTTIPTLDVRKLGRWNNATIPPTFLGYDNLPEVVIDITAQQENSIVLSPANNRALPGVIIYYKSVNQVDNEFAMQVIVDKFPASVTDFTPEVGSHTFELGGSKLTHVQAQVNTKSIAQILSSSWFDVATWWKDHDKTLADANVDPTSFFFNGVHIPTVSPPYNKPVPPSSIIDESGNPIDTSVFKYELTDTSLPTWSGCRIAKATIATNIGFSRYKTGTLLDVKTADRLHTYHLRLTDCPGGFLQRVSQFISAEVVPQNVAESAYRSAAAQQWAGSIKLLDAQIRGSITLGVRLKFIGPNTTFSNVLVQAIEQTPARGETVVTYGPGPLVDIDLWVEMARASRYRITYDMPSGRADGGVGAGPAAIDTGGATPADNTAHGVGGHSVIGAYSSER
jgi:hypothetical protein